MARQPTFLEELMAAGRGVMALLIGDKRAGGYFDLSRRGLAGSFIALLVIVAIGAYLPIILSKQHDSAIVSMAQLVIIFAFQIGFTAIVLRQVKRMDALIPYTIAYNWLSFFVTLIYGALLAAGVTGDLVTIAFGIVVIIIEVNIGRIILTLPPLQIAMLIIAQIIGVSIAAAIVVLTFPLPPGTAAQLGLA